MQTLSKLLGRGARSRPGARPRDLVAGGPYTFLRGSRYREAELRSYILREHRRGRPLSEILDDAYVQRAGSRTWKVLSRPETIAALEADVREAIERYRP